MKRTVSKAIRLVYLVTPEVSSDLSHMALCVAGGVTALWLRDPRSTPRNIYECAAELVPWAHRRGVAVMVSDHIDVARASGADGVHVGRRSLPAQAARAQWPGWLGVSCHDLDELEAAQAARADFATLSPVFAVPRKGEPLGRRGFCDLRDRVEFPLVALGGLNPDTAHELKGEAAGLAVRSALRDSVNPTKSARRMREMTSA